MTGWRLEVEVRSLAGARNLCLDQHFVYVEYDTTAYPLDAGVAGARGLGLTLICRTEHLKNRIKNVEITS